MPLGYDLFILRPVGDESLKSVYRRIVDFEQEPTAEGPPEECRIDGAHLEKEFSCELGLNVTVRKVSAVSNEKGMTEMQADLRFGGYLLDTLNDSTLCFQVLLSRWCGRIRYLSWGLSEEDRVALVEGWGKIVDICQKAGLRIYDPLYDREAADAYSGQIVQGIDSQLRTVEMKYGKTEPVDRP